MSDRPTWIVNEDRTGRWYTCGQCTRCCGADNMRAHPVVGHADTCPWFTPSQPIAPKAGDP